MRGTSRPAACSGQRAQVGTLPVPSVTHVLSCLGKPALINWAASEERKLIIGAAADLYQDAHGTPLMLRAVYTDTLLKRVTKVKAHQRALAKAGEIGSQVHAMAEWFLRKELGQVVEAEPPLSPEARAVLGIEAPAMAPLDLLRWLAPTHPDLGLLTLPDGTVVSKDDGPRPGRRR